ncbi:MAG: TerB family tellurite resistance protein [Polyangiales bacterium]
MDATADRIAHVADILLGAAYADGAKAGSEDARLRKLLGELLKTDTLPDALDARIRAFDPKGFDLAKAAAVFAGDPSDRKRKLLELVAAVGDADEVLDTQEDDYLVRVAKAIGAPKESYADLVLEVEELRDALQTVRQPPPLPKR